MWLAALVLPLSGCSDTKLDQFVQKIFKPRLTPQQNMLVAVSDADPDLRRDAVAQIAKSKHSHREWAIKGYVAIALLESDPQARCVALRALARTLDERAVTTALKILNYPNHPPQEVRPPDDMCRWDATQALADLTAQGAVAEELRPAVRATLCDRLVNDDNRHVRIAAARGLSHYPAPESLRALIDGLRDPHFAVAHACEAALTQLTGVSHNYDVIAWEDWFQANSAQPFASAGQIPESRRAPYRNGWEKFAYDTQQFLRWVLPGKKEQ